MSKDDVWPELDNFRFDSRQDIQRAFLKAGIGQIQHADLIQPQEFCASPGLSGANSRIPASLTLGQHQAVHLVPGIAHHGQCSATGNLDIVGMSAHRQDAADLR